MFFSIHLVHLGLQSEYISDIPAASVFLLHTYLYFHTHNTAVSYDFSAAYAPSVLSHHKDNSGHFSNEIPENPPCFSNQQYICGSSFSFHNSATLIAANLICHLPQNILTFSAMKKQITKCSL